jgi:hypothetical protein
VLRSVLLILLQVLVRVRTPIAAAQLNGNSRAARTDEVIRDFPGQLDSLSLSINIVDQRADSIDRASPSLLLLLVIFIFVDAAHPRNV